MIENFRERETTMRSRRRDHWCDEIETMRSAVPMSFGSRTRMRSVTMRLAGAIGAVRLTVRGFAVRRSRVRGFAMRLAGGATILGFLGSRSLSLSLSLFARVSHFSLSFSLCASPEMI